MVKTRFLHDFNTILARFISKDFRLGIFNFEYLYAVFL